jgi:transketolase
MRTAFITELIEQARRRPEIFLVVGDLGYSVVEPFVKEFPDRFLNAGVAEQNMTGVAAGLASEGYHVFTYSIGNFSTLRCLEQIRNDICYHRLPVTVVAVGGGMAYGNLGYSHHAVQDLAIMRTLPNLHVFAPGDPGETKECVQWLAKNPCPSYLRVGKAGEPTLHTVRGVDRGPLHVKTGAGRAALVATGGVLKPVLDAQVLLNGKGIELDVFSLPCLKPLNPALLEPLASFRTIVAIEEHVAEGGLASALREHLFSSAVVSLNVSEQTAHQVGTQDYLRGFTGLSAAAICEKVQSILG